jgi:hypothetical protein
MTTPSPIDVPIGVQNGDIDLGDEIHPSPALAEIFGCIRGTRPFRILDLGAARRANLEHYFDIADGVRIAHLLRDNEASDLRRLEPGRFTRLLDGLTGRHDTAFDLILLWDVLNYLGQDQVALLARNLARVAERGARLHALVYTTPTMPTQPSTIEIVDAQRLRYRLSTDRRCPTPDLPPALVERLLRPARVTRSVLLRHGVREYLGVLD